MSQRGITQKFTTDSQIVLERAMITRHYRISWNLDSCVGCQIGPLVCPKDAVIHLEGEIENGRIVRKPTVDIDPDKCVFCGMCAVMCPTNAIKMTINDKPEIPILDYGAFPELIKSTEFDKDKFDWSRKDFVIENCPTHVISYDETESTMVVDQDNCIHCRQCEVATSGAFQVTQPWQGSVTLKRDLCVEGCYACADICPTRALHIDEEGNLVLADYYCIKCGACMQVCPVRPEMEDVEITVESQGVKHTRTIQKITNADKLPIMVERWRVGHQPVSSGAWIDALRKLADDKAGATEIDRKRALRRRDLLKALAGSKPYFDLLEGEE